MSLKPIIGVTGNQLLQLSSAFDGTSVAYTPQFFIDGLQNVGASPLIMPIGDEDHAKQYVSLIDGLLLTGGYDVNPKLYNEAPHPALQAIFPKRDTFELALIDAAIEKGIPIFAVCRGMQLLNVHFGGSLYQDLPTQVPNIMQHVQKTPFDIPVHAIEVEKDSYLYSITGDELMVNTFHHQAIKELASEFKSVAKSSDGLIEAIESVDSNKDILGVQWHPEIMMANDETNKELFADFVRKAAKK